MRLDHKVYLRLKNCRCDQLRKNSFVYFPGSHNEEATPVPIPNTEVKLFCADGTAPGAEWESRSLPGFFFAPKPCALGDG